MTKQTKYLSAIISALVLSTTIVFITINPKIKEVNQLKIEIETKTSELQSMKEKLIELDLKNWDKQITGKLDDYLELGKRVVEFNVNNELDLNIDLLKSSKSLFERILYTDNIQGTFYSDEDYLYTYAYHNPRNTIILSYKNNKDIESFVLDENNEFDHSDTSDGLEWLHSSWYSKISNSNREHWDNIYTDLDGNCVMTFSKGVFDKENKKIGVWGIELMFSDIQAYLEELKPTLNTKVNVLFNPKNQLAFQDLDEETNIIRYTDYSYDNYDWKIQWIIPKNEFENYGIKE